MRREERSRQHDRGSGGGSLTGTRAEEKRSAGDGRRSSAEGRDGGRRTPAVRVSAHSRGGVRCSALVTSDSASTSIDGDGTAMASRLYLRHGGALTWRCAAGFNAMVPAVGEEAVRGVRSTGGGGAHRRWAMLWRRRHTGRWVTHRGARARQGTLSRGSNRRDGCDQVVASRRRR
ncbi:formin-like protein 5 [Iris pallida]|uniref:Formin-like protein 5 n=1 Tax=Iris pallida TaxID=29817 RepID=A0AAX6FTL9_IRIPA|nr:formin-like protein 5 [Iris pallida]